jgi:hypothetical protein
MNAITGWTIGQRRNGEFSVRLWWRDADGRRCSAPLLTESGEDALFPTQREATKAARLFERSNTKAMVAA